jgi:PAS domain S-box-containing protein
MNSKDNQFRALVENSPEAIFVGDGGRFVYVNPAAVRLLGAASADDLIGKPVKDRIHPDYHAMVDERVQRIFEDNASVPPIEEKYIRLDGSLIDVEVSAAPFRYGDLNGGLVFLHDITERKKAEAVLRTQAERHATLLATTGDGFWICDLDGKLLEVNEAFARMSGYTCEELLQLSIPDIEAVETAADTAKHIQIIIEKGFDRFETRHRRKNGEIYDVEILASYWSTQKKLLVFSRDISERKKTEAELSRSRELLRSIAISKALTEAIGIGVIGVDAEHRVVFANPCAQQLLGAGESDMLGRELDDVVRASTGEGCELTNASCPAWQFIAAGQAFQTEDWTFTRRDGSCFPVSLVIAPIVDSSVPAGSVLSFHDITVRKQAEQALRDADRRKDEFVAMLAHELRNPLAPIRNAAFILGRLGLNDPKLFWAQEIIERQVEHLSQLVDELLDVSRIVRGKIELKNEPIDLITLIAQVTATSQAWFASKSQHFSVHMPEKSIWLNGDLVRLTQVLLNLLDNAAKYTPEGGSIELTTTENEQEIEIWVRDNGQGISAELLPRVFDLFQQGDRTLDRSQGGLGIGLTLVQQIVNMHGGRVEAHSAGMGRGSTFIVRLPRAGSAAEHAARNQQLGGATSAARILIVEDDPDVASSTATLLDKMGYATAIADSGAAALALTPSFRPRVVLLDIGLKGMDGFETARRLRQLEHGGDFSLVAVTGYADEETRVKAIESGCDYHLAKPVDPNELLALLESETSKNDTR